MLWSIVLAFAAAAQAPPAALPQQVAEDCGLAGSVSASRELADVIVVRRTGGPGPMEPMECLERWVNGRKLPIAIVSDGDIFADGWVPIADIAAPHPSGILVEGAREAVAAARAEAERLGLPVKDWRDTIRPAAILVGTRMPAAELAARVRSGALGRLDLGYYSIWEPDPEPETELGERVQPQPFEMIFTGPAAEMPALEKELRGGGWTVVASVAEGGTAFLEARIVPEGTDMPEILGELGAGRYPGIRVAFLTRGMAMVAESLH